MIGICGFWEPFHENVASGLACFVQIWRENMKTLGGKLLIFVDPHDLKPQKPADSQIVFETYPTLQAALKAHPEKTWVFIEFESCIPKDIEYEYLRDFRHPSDEVIYVVGHDTSDIGLKKLDRKYLKGNHVITIKTPELYGYRSSLWAHICIMIVLYDRLIKGEDN